MNQDTTFFENVIVNAIIVNLALFSSLSVALDRILPNFGLKCLSLLLTELEELLEIFHCTDLNYVSTKSAHSLPILK